MQENRQPNNQASKAAGGDTSHRGFSVDGRPITLWELMISFFRIGIFTIGGGLAMIPLLERIAVSEKKWLTEEEMVDCLAVSQALPGVVAINMATYTGNKLRGLAGALLATLGVVLPSFIIIIAIISILGTIGDTPYVEGALLGVKAAICGLILSVVIRNGKKTIKNAFGLVLAILAFVLIAFLRVDTALVILGAAIIGIGYQLAGFGKESTETADAGTTDEKHVSDAGAVDEKYASDASAAGNVDEADADAANEPDEKEGER